MKKRFQEATIIVHTYRKTLISAEAISNLTHVVIPLYSGDSIPFSTHRELLAYICELAKLNGIGNDPVECFGGLCYTNMLFYDISNSTYEADRYIIPKVR